MHGTMERLYQVAKDKFNICEQSALAAKLNQSPQALNNWEARGMSSAGILLASKVLGIDATWLSNGKDERGDIEVDSFVDSLGVSPTDGDILLFEEADDVDYLNNRRVKNLKSLTEGFKSKAEFSRTYSLDPNYISMLINGQRNIGEKTARKLERTVGKPEGWLDQEGSADEQQNIQSHFNKLFQSLDRSNQVILLEVAKTLKRHQRPPEEQKTLDKIKKLLGEDK